MGQAVFIGGEVDDIGESRVSRKGHIAFAVIELRWPDSRCLFGPYFFTIARVDRRSLNLGRNCLVLARLLHYRTSKNEWHLPPRHARSSDAQRPREANTHRASLHQAHSSQGPTQQHHGHTPRTAMQANFLDGRGVPNVHPAASAADLARLLLTENEWHLPPRHAFL